jgi:hypothetical protein
MHAQGHHCSNRRVDGRDRLRNTHAIAVAGFKAGRPPTQDEADTTPVDVDVRERGAHQCAIQWPVDRGNTRLRGGAFVRA